jgi:hypothetical protein
MGVPCRIIQTPGSCHYWKDVAEQLAWPLCSRNARPYPQKEVKVEVQVEQRQIRSGVFSTLSLDLSLDLSMRAQWKINQPPSLKRQRASLEGSFISLDARSVRPIQASLERIRGAWREPYYCGLIDLLCSRNVRLGKALVRRAPWRPYQPPRERPCTLSVAISGVRPIAVHLAGQKWT